MEERIKAVVSRSREVNMFGVLSHGHGVLLENLAERRDGRFYEAMVCIIVAAFKLEAYLNRIGTRLFPYWDDLERLSPRSKLRIIASRLDVTPDFGLRPFQTITELLKARDALAHGKPQILTEEGVLGSGTREELRRQKPLTKWETLCTIEFAQQAYEDTEEIADKLWEAAGFNVQDLRQQGHSYTISRVEP